MRIKTLGFQGNSLTINIDLGSFCETRSNVGVSLSDFENVMTPLQQPVIVLAV